MAQSPPNLTPGYLLKHSQDGWWPYLVGRGPSTEATAWCAIACREDSDAAAKSLGYLLSAQNKDGGWSTVAGSEPSDWSSGLALLAVQVLQKSLTASKNRPEELLKKAENSVKAGALHLLRSRADFLSEFSKVTMFILNGADFDYARGWCWSPDTFHWVEPTAYAVLALKMSPVAGDKRYKLALKEAQEYYLSKQCQSGGWNYGVPVSVGTKLPSQVVPTAWALIAMHDLNDAKLAKGVSLLADTNGVTVDTLQAQALCIMALKAHGIDTKDRITKLHEQFSKHEPSDQNFFVAGLCSIAGSMSSSDNPLLVNPRA